MPTEVANSNNDEEDSTKNSNNKRRQQLKTNMFAMPAVEKHNTTHSLRRDLLLSNFDKTMTVEKARFEPTEEPITTHSAPFLSTLAQIMPTSIPKINIIPNDHVSMSESTTEQPNNSPPTSTGTYTLPMSPSITTLSASSSTGTMNGNTLLTTVPLTTSHSLNDRKRLTQNRSEVIII
jgi:hypothetical protein